MRNEPKIGIILVNYNGYVDTVECIRSLREINYNNYEIIIVDNASTNESVEVIDLEIFGRNNEILLLSSSNNGFSSGNNIGIRYALEHGADYCLLLNNDTIVDKNFLFYLVQPFSTKSDCGVSIGKILYEKNRELIWYAGGSINPKTARTKHWHYKERDFEMSTEVQYVTFATGCCMCLSKELINKVGLLDESFFLYEEDTEYCLRLQKEGYRICYSPLAKIYHKVNASSGPMSSMSQFYTIRNKYRMIKMCIDYKYKMQSYLFFSAQTLIRSVRGDISFIVFMKAVIAFMKNKQGRDSRY